MAEPLCEYFGTCGGCTAQHLDYAEQLENKKKALAKAIRFPGILIFSDKEYGYRNRMDFSFHKSGLGLRKKDKPNHVVDVKRCVICNEKINSLLAEVNGYFKEVDACDLKTNTGVFKSAVIRATTFSSSILFTLNPESPGLEEAADRLKEFAKQTSADNIIINYAVSDNDDSEPEESVVLKGTDTLKEILFGKEFLFSAQGFFQNNTMMAEKMQEYCNSLLKKYDPKNAHLLDVYAGVGTFGIINSGLFSGTTMIESFKPCVKIAELNIAKNDAKNTKALALDAKSLMRISLPEPLFVIADPPRSGMDPKAIELLRKLEPKALIYISCNVHQLAKDLPKFKEYAIKSAALFDLFPQTAHSEAVVELLRK